ncbi:hypothetical protein [Cognatiluteimonas telluris]|jgi:hypothetical protein|uniref:hypothetical protein n=1 Tax=Cognatiluteimonas telluris TaxID=1104775 RepID=UPI00140E1E10|nr:hypothetical protein [Lysobacter telluris]
MLALRSGDRTGSVFGQRWIVLQLCRGHEHGGPARGRLAALIVCKHGGHIAPSEVERILRASADDLGKPGNDAMYGGGRVNAARAVAL